MCQLVRNRILVLLLLISVFALTGCSSRNAERASVTKQELEHETEAVQTYYYTTANIWYEKPNRIYSTNYHRGAIIPAGTKVRIDKLGKKEIQFTVVETKIQCTMIHVKRHSTIVIKELFDRYFSEQNVMDEYGAFNQFPQMEKDNIQNGTINVGMSKEAVLVAYGYPPSHKTLSLEMDIWRFWESRYIALTVYFKNNKVVQIKRGL